MARTIATAVRPLPPSMWNLQMNRNAHTSSVAASARDGAAATQCLYVRRDTSDATLLRSTSSAAGTRNESTRLMVLRMSASETAPAIMLGLAHCSMDNVAASGARWRKLWCYNCLQSLQVSADCM